MNKPRILIVEDGMVVALDIEGRLKRVGYEVVGRVDNAASAVQWSEETRPDLVLMDIRRRGDRDGIEAAHELRQRLGQPVVFLTAHADAHTLEHAGETQPFGYLLEPFEDRELQTVVEMALYKKKADLEIRRLNRLRKYREVELAAIYDHAPFMMCLIDRAGRMVRHNRALGMAAAAARDQVEPLVTVDGIACLQELASGNIDCSCGAQNGPCALRETVLATFETGESRPSTESLLTFVGATRPSQMHVAATTALVEVDAQPLALLCLEDVTRRKQLERQFLHAQKMEAVGQLAGGVAHDFNNILAAMFMNLALLRNPGRMESERPEAIAELERLAQRAADLTRQLLLFGRRQALQVARIDLNELLTGLVRMLQRLLGERIEVNLGRTPDPLWIDADPGMMEQVIVNLAVNARDAMPGGGRLMASTERVEFSEPLPEGRGAKRAGKFIRLRVADTGCGMDRETLRRIFEPFFTTKESGHGTGLGLATVHGIVEQHHGWIEVESSVGRGTSFTIYLPEPTGPARERRSESDGGEPVCGGTETILLVEDSENVRRMVALTLRSFGYTVFETSHGEEALERWSQDPEMVDLVLSDMVMPGSLSGLDLVQRMRQVRPELRAVISSGYSLGLVRQERVTTERIVYLPKPYQADTLARAIRKALDEPLSGVP